MTDTCPKCHGRGYVHSRPFWPVERFLDTLTACTCPAGEAFKAQIAAMATPIPEDE